MEKTTEDQAKLQTLVAAYERVSQGTECVQMDAAPVRQALLARIEQIAERIEPLAKK